MLPSGLLRQHCARFAGALLLVYFGVRSYRDSVGGGAVGFGRALAVGVLITCVGSACYVATWEVILATGGNDYMEKYQAYVEKQEHAKGTAQAEIDKKMG